MVNGLILCQGQYSLAFGAVSFVLTAAHVISSFPLLLSLTLKNRQSKRLYVLSSLLIGLMANMSWLLYAWQVDNLFVKIALVLWILTYLILFIHGIAVGQHNTNLLTTKK